MSKHKPQPELIEVTKDERVSAALLALAKWRKDTTPPCPPRIQGEAHCPDCSGIV